jgi:protein-S-isoprenylcysteine O-methyltransferase Ste14
MGIQQVSAGCARYWFVVTRGVLRFVVILAAMLFLAGRADYWQGWAWGGGLLAVGVAVAVAFRTKADVIEERIKPGPGTKWWDKLFYGLYLPSLLALLAIAALDAGRLHGSPPLRPIVYVAGYLVLGGAYWMSTWAMWTNRFFSSVVRIQTDRGHHVVHEGPYRFVRHPGYAGAILLWWSSAVVLGSLWALIPAGVITILFFVRTALEDATLKRELPGYAEYAQTVRHRLLPGVW